MTEMRLASKIFLLGALLLPLQLFAQWNPDPNSPKQVVTASTSPQEIMLVRNGNEGFFLVWEDKAPGGRDRILLNHYNMRGEVARNSNGVEVEGYFRSQSIPKVSQAIGGKISFAWVEEAEAGKKSLFVQQANSRINFSWSSQPGGVLVANPEGTITEYAVSLDAKNNTNIGWIEKNENSKHTIKFNRVDKDGITGEQEAVTVDEGPSQKSNLQVLAAPNFGAIVVWVDVQGGNSLIKFSLVDSSGRASEPDVISTVDGLVRSLTATTLSSGDHYLVWETAGRVKEMYHQLISSRGTSKWSKGGKKAVSNSGINTTPVPAETGDGDIILGWINEAAGDENIFVQKYDEKGNAQWGMNGSTIGKIKGRQFSQVLDGDNNGAVYVAWLDRRDNKTEIFAQKFNASGKLEWDDDGVAISNSQNPEKSYLQLTFDGKDGAVVVFKEKSKAGEGIYGLRLAGARPKPQGIVEAWLTYTDDEVKINWTGTNEKNVISYFIHRMEPKGKDTAWTEIDNVVAHPAANGAYYTFDSPDNDGNVVYRITQISKDNKVVGQKMVQGKFIRKSTQKVFVAQNVPNPFSGETVISYNVSGPGSVKFEFFDSAFKQVKQEIIKITKEGKYSYTFKAEGLKAGIYFYRFTFGTYVEVKKMAII